MGKLAALFFLFSSLAFCMDRAQGDCMQGGHLVVTNGINSTPRVMQSYVNLTGGNPTSGCTVTVYVTGSGGVTKAAIYSDNVGTVLANPFVADATGHWFFYSAGRVDVTMSGAGIGSPFTLGDIHLQDLVSVQDFGAQCNGTHDDTTAIQTALNAGASGGFAISLPGGVCLVSAVTIPTNTHLSGQGPGVSTIRQAAMSAVAGTPVMTNSIHGGGGNGNIRLDNFTLDGNRSNQSVAPSGGVGGDVNGITLINVSGLQITNLAFVNITSTPIWGHEWANFSVTNSTFSLYGYNSSGGNNTGAITLDYANAVGPSSKIRLSGNTIDGTGGNVGGIKLAGTSTNPFSVAQISNNAITIGDCSPNGCLGIELYNNGPTASAGFFNFGVLGNIVQGASATSGGTGLTFGISVAGAGGNSGVVDGNVVRWIGSFAIEIAANSRVVVSNNTIDHSAVSVLGANAPSIDETTVNADDLVFTGNVITNTINSASGILVALQVYSEGGGRLHNVSITNNVFDYTTTGRSSGFAIWLQCNGGSGGGIVNTVILGNTFRGPGSGTNIDGIQAEADGSCPVTNTLISTNTIDGFRNGIGFGADTGTRLINNYFGPTNGARYTGSPSVTDVFLDLTNGTSSEHALDTANTNRLIPGAGQYIQMGDPAASVPNVVTLNTTNGGDQTIGGIISTNSRQTETGSWIKTSAAAFNRALYLTIGAGRFGAFFGPAAGAGPNPPVDNDAFTVDDNGGAALIGIGTVAVSEGFRIHNYFIGSTTWAPGTIAAGGTGSKGIATTGCPSGAIGSAGFSGIGSGDDVVIQGVATTDSITVKIRNMSGSPITYGSGTVYYSCVY